MVIVVAKEPAGKVLFGCIFVIFLALQACERLCAHSLRD